MKNSITFCVIIFFIKINIFSNNINLAPKSNLNNITTQGDFSDNDVRKKMTDSLPEIEQIENPEAKKLLAEITVTHFSHYYISIENDWNDDLIKVYEILYNIANSDQSVPILNLINEILKLPSNNSNAETDIKTKKSIITKLREKNVQKIQEAISKLSASFKLDFSKNTPIELVEFFSDSRNFDSINNSARYDILFSTQYLIANSTNNNLIKTITYWNEFKNKLGPEYNTYNCKILDKIYNPADYFQKENNWKWYVIINSTNYFSTSQDMQKLIVENNINEEAKTYDLIDQYFEKLHQIMLKIPKESAQDIQSSLMLLVFSNNQKLLKINNESVDELSEFIDNFESIESIYKINAYKNFRDILKYDIKKLNKISAETLERCGYLLFNAQILFMETTATEDLYIHFNTMITRNFFPKIDEIDPNILFKIIQSASISYIDEYIAIYESVISTAKKLQLSPTIIMSSNLIHRNITKDEIIFIFSNLKLIMEQKVATTKPKIDLTEEAIITELKKVEEIISNNRNESFLTKEFYERNKPLSTKFKLSDLLDIERKVYLQEDLLFYLIDLTRMNKTSQINDISSLSSTRFIKELLEKMGFYSNLKKYDFEMPSEALLKRTIQIIGSINGKAVYKTLITTPSIYKNYEKFIDELDNIDDTHLQPKDFYRRYHYIQRSDLILKDIINELQGLLNINKNDANYTQLELALLNTIALYLDLKETGICDPFMGKLYKKEDTENTTAIQHPSENTSINTVTKAATETVRKIKQTFVKTIKIKISKAKINRLFNDLISELKSNNDTKKIYYNIMIQLINKSNKTSSEFAESIKQLFRNIESTSPDAIERKLKYINLFKLAHPSIFNQNLHVLKNKTNEINTGA